MASSASKDSTKPLIPGVSARTPPDNQSKVGLCVIKTTAVLRAISGAACLFTPKLVGELFQLSIAPQDMILARLFGVRDAVLGGLLWTAKDAFRTTDATQSEIRRALWANIITDSVDLCSCLVGLIDGTMSVPSAALVGGGAFVFALLGIVGLKSA